MTTNIYHKVKKTTVAMLCMAIPALLVALAMGACAVKGDDRPVITVTIEPLSYFAEQFGGD